MLKSNVCLYSNADILIKEINSIANTKAAGEAANDNDKKAIFKNCAPFIDCIREICNTQIDNSKIIDVVMLMYNLIKYSAIIIQKHLRCHRNDLTTNDPGIIVIGYCYHYDRLNKQQW